MAGAGYIIKTGITFDTKSAENNLKRMQGVLDELKTSFNAYHKQYEDALKAGDTDAMKAADAAMKHVQGLINAQRKMVNAVKSDLATINDALMNGLEGLSLNQLKSLTTQLNKEINKIKLDPNERDKADVLTRLLKQVQNEMNNIKAGFPDLEKQMMNFSKKGVDHLRELYQQLKQNREAMSTNADGTFNENMYIKVGQQMAKINEQITRMTGGFTDVFTRIKNGSAVSDAELKRVLESMKKLKDDPELAVKEVEKLEKGIAKLQEKLNMNNRDKVNTVLSGGFKSSIKETHEMIEQLQEYKKQLNSKTDAKLIRDTDKAIAQLTANLKAGEAGFKNMNDLIKNAEKVESGSFKGTVRDLKNMKDALETYKKSLKTTNEKELVRVNQLISNIDKVTLNATMDTKRFNEVVNKPKAASYNELKEAATRLKAELKDMTVSQDKYNEKAKQLRAVNEQIKKVEQGWKEHNSTLQNAFDRLKNYVLIYVGFQQAVSKINSFFSQNLELSDQMTNLQKVTNMADNEVRSLVDNLQGLDTRTTTTQLMQFAEQAGKLGIYTQHGAAGLQQFVEQAERINATLGEDIGGAQAVADLAKLADILGVTDQVGGNISMALDAVGSSILNLGNKSAASYASIVNYVGRLGAIGSTAGMTIPQLVALGGQLDALKMPAEAGSTALAQFIAAIQRNTEKMAEAAGVSAVELRNLVHGYTDEMGNMVGPDMMKAINMLLDSVRRGAASAQDLMDAMSGRSRTNVNIRSVLQLLSNNVDSLDESLLYAQQGYDSAIAGAKTYGLAVLDNVNTQKQASTMTQEFNRVNENAMGIMQRLKNTLFEIFTNAGWVDTFRGWLKSAADFVQTLSDSEGPLNAFRAAITGITTTVVAFKIGLVEAMVELGTLKGVAFTVGLGLEKLKGAIKGLMTSIKSIGWGLAISALTTLATWVMTTKNNATKLSEAIRNLNSDFDNESKKADALFRSLNKLTDKTAERKNVIDQINKQYGTYIGFMLKESDSVDLITAAHERLITKLKQEARQKQQNAIIDNVSQQYAGDINKYQAQIVERAGDELGLDLLNMVSSTVAEQLHNGIKDHNQINNFIVDKIKNDPKFKKLSSLMTGQNQVLGKPIEDLIRATVESDKTLDRVIESQQSFMAGEASALRADDMEKAKRLASTLENQIGLIESGGVTDKELSSYVENLQRMVAVTKDFSEEDDFFKRYYTIYNQRYSEYAQKLKDYESKGMREAIWGREGTTIETMSSKALADFIERINNIENVLKNDGGVITDLTQTFPDLIGKVNENNFEEIKEYLWEQATAARAELDRRHLNTGAKYKWDENGSGGRTKLKKQIQDEMNAYLQELDEYFERQREILKMQRDADEVTEEEYNRRMEANDMKHYDWRIKLRNMYLERANVLSQAEMDELNTIIDEGGDKFSKEGIGKTAKLLSQFGGALRQGVSLQAQKDATAIQKVLISRKEKIEKALLEDNFVDKVKDEFRRLADDLNLIFGIGETQEKRTLDLAKQRMQQLVAWSRDAYGMTVEQLKANMVDEENIYHDWYVSMGDQADDASKLLLKKLRDLQDNITDAERKAANEQKRIFDKQWESVEVAGGGTMKSNQEVATKAGETQVKANETAQQYGFGGYYLQGNAEIDLIKLQIEWKERYIRMLAKQMDAEIALEETKRRNAAEDLTYMEINGASEEEYRKKLEEHEALKAKIDSMQHQRNMMLSESYGELNELNQQFMEKDVEIASHYLEKLKEYQDHFDTAAQSFGEAIFGSKEDRQNAGRELLKSVLTTTKNVIQQYLIELATKQQVNQMKEIMEQAHVTKMIAIDNQLLASQGTQAVQQLSMQGAQAQAENVINIARGTGKEVASKGLVGLATSAAISAGLSLLLGMALSAINKKKTEIQATTGTTRKLSTGMLTYAEGRYPVLGNDGVTYHAKYEDKLSTGIYRGARFGIFSEKQPEAVIDGRTTQRIVMDYPYIWDAIMTIHRNGRLVNGGAAGMATHAAGTIQQVAETYANAQTATPSDATPDSTNAQMVELMARMITLLENPVSPTINMYGPGGLSDSIKKANRFSQRTKQ